VVVDVTHGIPAHDVVAGALALQRAIPFMPGGVHLAVVDPGVGTPRAAVILRCADGNLLVGPDNGLLWPAACTCGGVEAAWDIGASPRRLAAMSATFHGRDLFAPVAAALAGGEDPSAVGTPLDPDGLTRLELPAPVITQGEVAATVVAVDRFGNLQLHLGPEDLAAAGIEAGNDLLVRIALEPARAQRAVYGRTFADAAAEGLVAFQDSSGHVALAVNQGSAAAVLGAGRGTEVRLERGAV
jgi:S-adenosylmethionine hydrolase